MAAGEDELEPLVRDRRLVHLVLHGLRHVEQAESSSRASARGGCGRSRGCARSSRATRAGSPASRRGASARRRSRTLPERPPRRGRSRRGSRPGWRGRVPTRRGRPARGSASASLIGRTSMAPPMPAAGIRERELDRAVEVVRLEHEVAAERLLDRDERPVGRQRLAVLRRAPWSRARAARARARA